MIPQRRKMMNLKRKQPSTLFRATIFLATVLIAIFFTILIYSWIGHWRSYFWKLGNWQMWLTLFIIWYIVSDIFKYLLKLEWRLTAER